MAYIDRRQVIEAIRKYADIKHNNGEQIDYINGILKSISVINEQPTVNVVEVVKRGKWEFINQAENYLEPPTGDMCKCSKCNFKIDVSETLFKYCPNCGAQMDLGDDEE